jgi:hypothetical protein
MSSDSSSGSGSASNSGSSSNSGGGSGNSGSSSSGGDYTGFDWKQVMKAVTGSDPDDPGQNGSTISNPQTLQDAADGFWYAEQVLQDAATAISDQSDALAGPDGPWQGAAAKSFHSAMQSLSRQTQDMADTLSGGVTGDNNVPQQLADNAAHLRDAISKLNDIDVFYATEAVNLDSSLEMDNGRVRVSGNDKIKSMLDNDMRQVLVKLASHYRVNVDNVAYSTAPTNPTQSSTPSVGSSGVYGGAVSGATAGSSGVYGGAVSGATAGSSGVYGGAGVSPGASGYASGDGVSSWGRYPSSAVVEVPADSSGTTGGSGVSSDGSGSASGMRTLVRLRNEVPAETSSASEGDTGGPGVSSDGSGSASGMRTLVRLRNEVPAATSSTPEVDSSGYSSSPLTPGRTLQPAEGPGPVVYPSQTMPVSTSQQETAVLPGF